MKIAFHKKFEERVLADDFLGPALIASLDSDSPTSIRYNPFKKHPTHFIGKPIEWCENAVLLNERPSFTMDPLFHAGIYYPQESGSMMLDAVIRQLPLPEDPRILDLCAAPGGKSTLLSSFLNGKGLLVANEVIGSRSKILQENLTKWGTHNTVVTNSDPKEFSKLPDFFDLMVIDAPCSGEGMFRKTPAARAEWSEENVDLCSARQKRIVHDVVDSLKPGGFLIYSTCTFNTDENEKNVAYFLEELDLEIAKTNVHWAKSDRQNIGYYCLPNELNTEGFYFAILQKPLATIGKSRRTGSSDFLPLKNQDLIAKYLNCKDGILYQWRDKIFLLPTKCADDMVEIQQRLRIVKIGTQIGEMNRKGFQPSIELALHKDLLPNLPRVELTEELAIRYLRAETFPINSERGMIFMTYKGVTIGLIKHLGNRFNTFWPKEWRIRMT